MTTKLAVVDAAVLIQAGVDKIATGSKAIEMAGTWSRIEEFCASSDSKKAEVLLLGDSATSSSLKRTVQTLRLFQLLNRPKKG